MDKSNAEVIQNLENLVRFLAKSLCQADALVLRYVDARVRGGYCLYDNEREYLEKIGMQQCNPWRLGDAVRHFLREDG